MKRFLFWLLLVLDRLSLWIENMTNSYYNATGNPASATLGRAANIRAEFAAIGAGFDAVEAAVAAKAAAANPSFTGATSNAVGSASLPSYTFTGDTNTGMWWPFADQIAWSCGGTERMRLSANGLGVGTIASYKLHVYGVNAGSFVMGAVVNDDTSSGSHSAWLALSGTIQMQLSAQSSSAVGRVGTFSNHAWAGYTNQIERFRVTTNGEVLVGLTSATSGGAKLQTVDGITFPATQVLSSDPNTLDDYEEGTWDPDLYGSSSRGSATYTFGTRKGKYTKIGNLVTVTGQMTWTAHNGTGNMQIDGLPYPASGWSGDYCPVALVASNVACTAGSVLTAYFDLNGSVINIMQMPTGGGALAAVPLDTAGTMYFSFSYPVS